MPRNVVPTPPSPTRWSPIGHRSFLASDLVIEKDARAYSGEKTLHEQPLKASPPKAQLRILPRSSPMFDHSHAAW